jgi:histone H2A
MKDGKSKARGRKAGKPAVSGSVRAGTTFPVARCNRMLKQGRYGKRVGGTAGAYMAAVLEYVAAEILELAGDEAHAKKQMTLKPKHLGRAVQSDGELGKLMANT